MPVPSTMQDLATIPSSNSPAGTEPIGNSLDDYIRSLSAILRSTNAISAATIAAASTTDLGSSSGEAVIITGSATINSFGAGFAGCYREVRFSAACTITASANIIIPGGGNIVTNVGEILSFRCLSSGVWYMASVSGVRRQGDSIPGSLASAGTITGDSGGGGSVAAFRIGNDAELWDIGTAGAAAIRGFGNLALGRLYYGNTGSVYYGVDSASPANTSEMGVGQFHKVSVAGGVLHYNYNNSQHIAQFKRAGGFSWYWRTNSTGTPSGTGEFQAAELDNSGNFTAAGNVTGGSDERVKENWRDLPADFLERLVSVKYGTYDRTDIKETQTGVGAQSLRKLLPHVVRESDEGFLSVAYGNAAMVSAIEVAKRVLKLERRLKEIGGD